MADQIETTEEYRAGVQAERERCARVAEEWAKEMTSQGDWSEAEMFTNFAKELRKQ